MEEIKTFFFFKPHNETTNETLTIYFTLKWKNTERSSFNFNEVRVHYEDCSPLLRLGLNGIW